MRKKTDFLGGFAKGLSVIEVFSAERPRQSIAEVASASGLDRATARRCLLTLAELGRFLLDLGVWDAIQLDGGGSSTLALRSAEGSPSLLNRPCHTQIPGRQRPVANFLGLMFSSPGRLDAGGGLGTLVPMEKSDARDSVAGEEP